MKKLIFYYLIVFLFQAGILFSAEKFDDDALLSSLTGSDRVKYTEAIDFIKKNQPVGLVNRIVKTLVSEDPDDEDVAPLFDALRVYDDDRFIGSWIDILKRSGSKKIKLEVIGHLGRVNSKYAVEPLASLLSSPWSEIREKSAKTLVNIGDDRVFPYILRMAESLQPVERIYALEAMMYLYDRRFYSIITDLLKDDNKSIRIYALKCLYKNGLKEALFLIRGRALNDNDAEVRDRSVRILGDFYDDKALYVLLRTLNDSDRNVRYSSVRALTKLRLSASAYELSSRLYKEDDHEIKDGIVELVILLRKAGTLSGFERVLYTDESIDLRIKAAYALGIIRDDRAASVLVKGLQNRDYRVRAEICNSLGYYRQAISMNALLRVIEKDKKRYVRSSALYALKKQRDKRSILRLFDVFAAEDDPVFREIMRKVLRGMMDLYL